MSQKASRYLSYLLRLWQTSDGTSQVWRASLESSDSRKRYSFADLRQLMAFLEHQTGETLFDEPDNETPLEQSKKT
jgi:hypothetical protein